MPRFAASLTRKFALGTAAGLLASSLVFLVLFVGLFRGQLEEQRADAAGQVNRLLQISLENAMLRHDLDGLREIVQRLGQQPDVIAVTITNPQGEVRFADDPTRVGERLPPEPPAGPTTRLVEGGAGGAMLRSINPVRNQTPCQQCHGPMAEHPINGFLYVDYDADSIRHQARRTTFLLMGAGSLIVLLNLTGGWWFMRRYVLRPVAHLADASARLSNGDLATRTHLTGGDELTGLGETMNRMAEALERKMAELEEKEQFLQQLVDAFPDGVRVIDQDYRVLLSNATYRRQIGPATPHALPRKQGPELIALPCYAQTHGQDQPCPETLITCPLREVTRTGAPLRTVHRLHRADGGGLDVETYAAPMTVTRSGETRHLVVESIRDLDQAVRFSHEQRLSELGRLAAGVAHEIHNPLGSVRLALHAAEAAAAAEAPDLAEVQACLALVDQEVDSCIQVTHRLLRLSVPPPDHQELVDVAEAVDDTLKLIAWEAGERSVQLRQGGDHGPLRVMATDTELRMAILNLAQNALHAMPKGGTLTVECRRRDGWIDIAFTDTGVGIAPEDLGRIFQPFFSRRADGVEGTGLGLSITKAFVDGHGGHIAVVSKPGGGSRFSLQFPDADLEPSADGRRAGSQSSLTET
jgi:signal transduction histidine kinase